MADSTIPTGAALIAELQDLLSLDHDAVQAYSIAIGQIASPEYREALAGFRGDHQRHIDRLSELIRAHGGVPVEAPHPTGVFKAAMQALGGMGGDRAVLLAFKTNEGQVRDKYRRHAQGPHDPGAAAVIRQAAADEERHYAWVSEALEAMDAGPGTLPGALQSAAETVQGRAADAAESAGRRAAEVVGRMTPRSSP
jgi:rubrerythrin